MRGVIMAQGARRRAAVIVADGLDISGQITSPGDFCISGDGLTVFVVDDSSETIYQYNLSSAWDMQTGAYSGKSIDLSSELDSLYSISMQPDGSKIFLGVNVVFSGGSALRILWSYSMLTPGDIQTINLASRAQAGHIVLADKLDVSADGLRLAHVHYDPNDSTNYLQDYDLQTPYDLNSRYGDQNAGLRGRYLTLNGANGERFSGATYSQSGDRLWLIVETATSCEAIMLELSSPYELPASPALPAPSSIIDLTALGAPSAKGLQLKPDGTAGFFINHDTMTLVSFSPSV